MFFELFYKLNKEKNLSLIVLLYEIISRFFKNNIKIIDASVKVNLKL